MQRKALGHITLSEIIFLIPGIRADMTLPQDWKNKAGNRYSQLIEGLYNLLGFYPTKVTKTIKKGAFSAF
jgi:hypothetical protein